MRKEAELMRQIAAEEERERQEAEAAERERVAEEIRKLEEEECQRREAEHRAEAVRRVQAPESPVRVDDGDESLTSLAVYFRNCHMFREDMNNIPC